MNKIISLILCLLIIPVSILGCNERKAEVIIKPEINQYSPLMSSVPGIPLNAEFKTEGKNKKVKYHWTSEEGIFLNWEQGSWKISELGKDIKNDGEKIYWSANVNNKIEKSSFKIHLKVEESGSLKVLAQTSIEIKQNKEGYFTVKE